MQGRFFIVENCLSYLTRFKTIALNTEICRTHFLGQVSMKQTLDMKSP